MNANLAAVLYLVSGVLFILALRGLSSPETSRAGNRTGMLGMVIAMTLLGSVVLSAVSSNTTICLVVIIGVLFIGEHLNKIALRQSEPVKSITYTLYYVIPHFEIFDVRGRS